MTDPNTTVVTKDQQAKSDAHFASEMAATHALGQHYWVATVTWKAPDPTGDQEPLILDLENFRQGPHLYCLLCGDSNYVDGNTACPGV